MARYIILTNGSIRDKDTGAEFPQDVGNSDYDIYLNWKKGVGFMGEDLGTGPNEPDVEKAPTLLEVQKDKIEELKALCNTILSKTDWYVTRSQETLKGIPSDIANYRKSVRSYVEKAEKEIFAIKTIELVNSYKFKFPK